MTAIVKFFLAAGPCVPLRLQLTLASVTSMIRKIAIFCIRFSSLGLYKLSVVSLESIIERMRRRHHPRFIGDAHREDANALIVGQDQRTGTLGYIKGIRKKVRVHVGLGTAVRGM